MAEDRKIILDFEVNGKDAAAEIVKLNEGLAKLKNEREKMIKAGQRESVEYQQNEAAIRALTASIRKQQGIATKSVQITQQNEGSLAQLRSQLSMATAAYDALSEAERKNTKGIALRDKINDIMDALKQGEEETQRFYRNVGNYASPFDEALTRHIPVIDQLKAAFVPLGSVFSKAVKEIRSIGVEFSATAKSTSTMSAAQKAATLTTAGLSAALKILKVALISTGIGAIAVALGSLVAYLTKTQKGTELLSKSLAAVGAVVNVIIDRLAKLGGALVKLFSGDFKGAAEDAKAAVSGIGEEIVQETKQAVELADKLNDIEKRETMLTMKRAAGRNEIAKLKKIADDTTKSMGERLAAIEKAERMEKELADEEMAIAQERLANTLGLTEVTEEVSELMQRIAEGAIQADEAISKLGLSESTVKDLKGLADEYVNVMNKQAESSTRQIEMQNKKQAIIKENAEKIIALELSINESRIKAESGYQSEDFAMKQSYARRLYELQAASEQKSLQLQRQSGTLSESEYRTRLEVLANARREFNNQQAKEANAYYKQQREAILGLFDKNTEERIAEVNRKFEKAYEQLRAMGEKDEPDPSAYAGGESDEQYQKDFNEYREFMFNRAVLEMRMQQQQERELKEIRRTALRERAEEIEKAISEEYENDLRKYQTNERRKLEIMLESLEKQKQAKEKEGLDTYDEDAQILDTTRKLNQLALDADLLAAGENAKAKYDLRVKWAERERELAESNAQRLAEIDQAEGEAYREMIEARIAEVEKWANASMELMSGVNDLFNALGEAQVQKAEEKHAKESVLLQEQLDNGLISQKEYDKKQEQLDKNLEKEQAKIARQQAIREKAMAMFKIAIDTATAIMGLWANPGFPAAIPLSVTVGALGAIQLAAVAAQPLPKAARGRYIKGKSHAQGGELVVAEDGEIIMNKNSVRMFGPALSAMSVAGGGVPFPTHIPDGGYTARYAMSSYAAADEIGDAVGKAMKKVKIYTTVEDIRRGERAYTIVEGRGEV